MITTSIYILSIALVLSMPFIISTIRRRMYRDWLPVQGRVRRSYVKLIVDVDSLFVDVEYEYGGRRYVGLELNTMQLVTIEYGDGDYVKLLINPSNPSTCALFEARASTLLAHENKAVISNLVEEA